MFKKLLSLSILIAFGACMPIDLNTIPSLSKEGHTNAVIEIPAGTNKKIEYNKTTRKFEIDQRNGKDRVINFLPYPGNYGFIPSTYSNPEKGGDGDALDIMVISESVRSGTVMRVIPIGMLKLIDDNELDYKIIAIPSEADQQIVSVASFEELQTKHPQLVQMIENWFLSYDTDPATVEGWGDEKEALAEIRKWTK